ncbi:neuroblast differentiation-associated protein AHNAK-like, partial [Arapaima gigas]
MPEASVEIRGPEVDIKSPEIDGKIEAEVGGSPSKFKLPTIKMPKFGTSASKGKVELTGVQAD